jgi:hypothetical protein
MKLIIDIDVQNPEEIVKAHKGELLNLISLVMLSKEKKKNKVEKAICEEMLKILKIELPKALEEEMVDAIINYDIID